MPDEVVSIPVEPPFDQIGAAAFISVVAHPNPIQFARLACSPMKSNRPDGTMVTDYRHAAERLQTSLQKNRSATEASIRLSSGLRPGNIHTGLGGTSK